MTALIILVSVVALAGLLVLFALDERELRAARAEKEWILAAAKAQAGWAAAKRDEDREEILRLRAQVAELVREMGDRAVTVTT